MYVARQPIVDRNRKLAGYELLFRSPEQPVSDGVFATAAVVAKAFADVQLAEVLGEHRGFINIDSTFLMSEMVEVLPPDRCVLELLEDTVFTPDIVARCVDLKAKGYLLASDDYCGDRTALEPAAKLLDIIKVDLPLMANADLRSVGKDFPGKCLLAEKVETQEELDRCLAAGYELFQGYFFAKPVSVGDASRDPGRMAALKVLAMVMQDEEDTAIEAEVKRQPKLGVGLLRLANSAAAGLAQPISSMKQALFAVGRAKLERWLQLLVYLDSAGGDPGSEPLLQMAAVRGKTMESLARYCGRTGDRAFLVGLVSLFDVALGISRDDVARRLGLDDEVREALVDYEGVLGALLALAEAMEQGRDEQVRKAFVMLPEIPREALLAVTADAMRWASALGDP